MAPPGTAARRRVAVWCVLLACVPAPTGGHRHWLRHGSRGQAAAPSSCPVDEATGFECGGADHGVCGAGLTRGVGACLCKTGWGGHACEVPMCPNGDRCGAHGRCNGQRACACDEGYEGERCEIRSCRAEECVHGLCLQDECFCEANWRGRACDERVCEPACGDGFACSNGTCVAAGAPPDVSGRVCPRQCSGKGKCIGGVCFCEPGRGGTGCQLQICPGDPQCGGHGACFMGQCLCDSPYGGAACAEERGDVAPPQRAGEEQKAQLMRELHSNQERLRQVKAELAAFLHDLASAREPPPDAEANLRELQAEARKLADENSGLLLKIDNVLPQRPRAEAAAAAAAGPATPEQRQYEELALQLFAEDHRDQTVRRVQQGEAARGGDIEGVVGAELRSMWGELPPHHRTQYINAAKAAAKTEQRAWALAEELFGDTAAPTAAAAAAAGEAGGARSDVEAASWRLLPMTEKMHFFTAARQLADGGTVPGDVSAAVQARANASAVLLEKAVQDLAFRLYSDAHWQWALDHATQRGAGKGSAIVQGVHPDAQHALASSYRTASVQEREKYLGRAEQLLSSSFFVEGGKGEQSTELPSLRPTAHRSVLGFTLQLVGLRKADYTEAARGKLSLVLAQLLEESLGQHTTKLVEDRDNAAVAADLQPYATARFAVILERRSEQFLHRAIKTLTAAVEQGRVERLMADYGLGCQPLFSIGGYPAIVFDGASETGRCPADFACGAHGSCEDGVCRCARVSLGYKLYEYSGHDCSVGPSRVCPSDCSLHGICMSNGTCTCYAGFSGPACSRRTCPQDCAGHGTCDDGVCACEAGWRGADCSERTLECDCKGHGTCDYRSGKCTCDAQYSGPHCDLKACPFDCGAHGRCHNGTCACDERWSGKVCDRPSCERPDCSGHGACLHDGALDASCQCEAGFHGEDCACPSASASSECSGHGVCQRPENYPVGRSGCFCEGGWTGESCNLRLCSPPDCGGHGTCDGHDGTCKCDDGWAGGGCLVKTCKKGCSGHGECDGAECACEHGWQGASCEWGLADCPDFCNADTGQGKCVDGGCQCESGWEGATCGIQGCPTASRVAGPCSGHGTCEVDQDGLPDGPGDGVQLLTCRCDAGWDGVSCADVVPLAPPVVLPGTQLEQCALCCLSKCNAECSALVSESAHTSKAHAPKKFMDCYGGCQKGCLSRCSAGEDRDCPSKTEMYEHMMDAFRTPRPGTPAKATGK